MMFIPYTLTCLYQSSAAQLIRETIVTNLIAQLTVQPLTLYYVAWPAFLYFGTSESLLETLPSASTLAGQFLLCCLFNDWFFYWYALCALHHGSETDTDY